MEVCPRDLSWRDKHEYKMDQRHGIISIRLIKPNSLNQTRGLSLRQEDLAQGKRSLVRKVNTRWKSIADRRNKAYQGEVKS